MTKKLPKFSILMLFLILVGSSPLLAQQEAMYSQYMFNGLVINPAYAGSQDAISAIGLFRRQWLNVAGAPQTQTLSVHAPLNRDKVGVGMNIINDRVGISNMLTTNGIYAYRIKLPNNGVLSMGLQAGISRYFMDYTLVDTNPEEASDIAFSDIVNHYSFNLGSGLYYYTKRFYAGASIPHMINRNLGSGDPNIRLNDLRRFQHYFLTAGYVFDVSDELSVKPSTLIKYVNGAPLQFDINTQLYFYDVMGVGISYRSSDSFVAMVEFRFARNFRMGYAYDQPITRLAKYITGSHEFMLRYDFSFSPARVISPRFF